MYVHVYVCPCLLFTIYVGYVLTDNNPCYLQIAPLHKNTTIWHSIAYLLIIEYKWRERGRVGPLITNSVAKRTD